MAGTVLLVITEGFDDMAYLSNQVILEEAGNDVIPVSGESGALKGETSSVMTVSISDALSQDIPYVAMILIGGNGLQNINELEAMVTEFHQDGKIIGAIGSGIEILKKVGINSVSDDGNILMEGNIITMKIPERSEEFAEKLAGLIP